MLGRFHHVGQFSVPFIGFSNFQIKWLKPARCFVLAAGVHHGLFVADHGFVDV